MSGTISLIIREMPIKTTTWNDDTCTRKLKLKPLKRIQYHLYTSPLIFCTTWTLSWKTLDKHKLGDILQNNCILQKCQHHERWTKAKEKPTILKKTNQTDKLNALNDPGLHYILQK